MSSRLSVLRKFFDSQIEPPKVQWYPYPHVVIDNALPELEYSCLLRDRPSYEWIVSGRDEGDNIRLDVPAHQSLARDLPDIWSRFVKFHVSPEFWGQILHVFGDQIKLHYPQLGWRGYLDERPGVRNATEKHFWLDCNIGLNTPCIGGETRVRGPHLDNPVELFAGMLYMGNGEGGELVVNELIKEPEFYGKQEIRDNCVREVGRVPYRHNQAVFFINTPCAVHSVTSRNSSDPRNLVNFIGEYAFPLYQVKR